MYTKIYSAPIYTKVYVNVMFYEILYVIRPTSGCEFLPSKPVGRIEVCTDRIFQSRPGRARMATISARSKEKNFGPGPTRPERGIKI